MENINEKDERRHYDFHQINAECVKRTSDALAEGKELAHKLEQKIVENKIEREREMVKVNDRIDTLDKNLEVLNNNVMGVNGFLSILKQIKETMSVMSEKLLSHDTNFMALNSKLDNLELFVENEKKSKEPWQKIFFSLLEKAILAIAGFLIGHFFLG